MTSQWTLSLVGGSLIGALAYCNLPVWMWYSHQIQNNSIGLLREARLNSLGAQKDTSALDLWKNKGAVVMAVRRPG